MKSRFCPSPTGYLHLGNARTALFNALLAQHQSGKFLLRIEDTDKSRSFDHYTQALLEDLQWLGLHWHEGPNIDGQNAPYWQSQRQSIYDTYYEKLVQHELVYPCFCSDTELAIMRKVQLASGRAPRYSGRCRALTPTQIAQQEAKGIIPTLRFQVPKNQTIEFVDLVRGMQRFNSDDIGDFIIRRADGSASFIFSNAIDDALMDVTHALRGEDHLTNTPRQLMVIQALGLKAPNYGHIALIVGSDGSPLSKRHGSLGVVDLREQGFLPEAVLNYLARLGHSYTQNQFLSLAELAQYFSSKNLGTAPSRFDFEQLLYWQRMAVSRLSAEQAWDWLGTSVKNQVPLKHQSLFIQFVKPNLCFPKDVEVWLKVLFGTDPLVYSSEHREILATTGIHFFEQALKILQQTGLDFKLFSQNLGQVLNMKGKALYQPLRVALTDQVHGPEMVGLFELLGLQKLTQRFQNAMEIK
jgi:glutamyl-tRNA synthetase